MENAIGAFAILVIGLLTLFVLWRALGGTASAKSAAAKDPGAEKAGAATPPAAPAPKPEPEVQPEAAEETRAAPPGPAPANLYSERPDEVDDLRQIKGIGPKMEALLNEKGVYKYSQLAAFTDEDLAWLDAAAESFPGRAERDGWVAQARELQAAKEKRA